MLQKKWFKIFIYFIATTFFFIASSIIIAVYTAGPSEQQTMAYMSGMMKSMESSLMGLSMAIEGDNGLRKIISNASSITSALITVAIISGGYIRYIRRKKNG